MKDQLCGDNFSFISFSLQRCCQNLWPLKAMKPPCCVHNVSVAFLGELRYFPLAFLIFLTFDRKLQKTKGSNSSCFLKGNIPSEPRLFLFMCNSRLTQQSATKYLCQSWPTGSRKQIYLCLHSKPEDKYIWKLSFFSTVCLETSWTRHNQGLCGSN